MTAIADEDVAEAEAIGVPAGVSVIRSTCGTATLETVFHSTREQSDVLHANGFTWCAQDKVLLRVHANHKTTVADLVAIDALRATYTDGACVLRARAYLCPFAYSSVNVVCKGAGFS